MGLLEGFEDSILQVGWENQFDSSLFDDFLHQWLPDCWICIFRGFKSAPAVNTEAAVFIVADLASSSGVQSRKNIASSFARRERNKFRQDVFPGQEDLGVNQSNLIADFLVHPGVNVVEVGKNRIDRYVVLDCLDYGALHVGGAGQSF